MADLSMFESGNGGNLESFANDLGLVVSLYNQPYLAFFGGQYEQSTPISEDDLENTIERFDWWGNSIMAPDDPTQQFNSETERTLDNVALNNEGLLEVRKAALRDLSFLRDIADVDVQVTIDGVNRIRIAVTLLEPDSLDERNFVFLWDGTRIEEIRSISDQIVLPLPLNVWDDNRIWNDTDTWLDII